MFAAGDVVAFWSAEAGKRKYHLCISFDGHYLFLNSPKQQIYPGDLVVDCSEFPFLTPTANGKSVISCNLLMKKTDAELAACGARCLGRASAALLETLVKFVTTSPILTEEEKESILDAAGDWA